MTLDELAVYLRSRDDFLVVSHDGPDADGIGASYALVSALLTLGKRAVAAVADALPPKFSFIDQAGLFVSLAAGDLPFKPQVAIVVDTHDLSYVSARVEALLAWAA